MNPNNYSLEQIKDIQEREVKGLQALKDLQLSPAAVISKVNIGNDILADKVQPYLRDTKYDAKISDNPEVNPLADGSNIPVTG